MKKSLLTIAFSLIVLIGYSQAKVELGLKGGLNSSTSDISNSNITVNSESTFHGGLYALIKLTKLGIQPEILYSPQKNEFVNGGNLSTQTKVYLDIPIMVKLYLAAGLNIQAGPQFSLLTSVDGAAGTTKDDFKNGDMSVAFGAGWDAPFGLQANVRYIVGLNDVNDNQALAAEIKNRTLQLSLGYRIFKVGK